MKLSTRIIYGLLGAALLVGYLATGTYGLSSKDKALYSNALEQQDYADTLGFTDFVLADYPVAVYTGEKEYVLKDDTITVRTPVLGLFAATAYEVDGSYQVIVPAYEDMKNLIGDLGSSSYGESEHVATLWHEAFHAWQFTNFSESIYALAESMEESSSDTIIGELDENAAYRDTFSLEQSLLMQAIQTEDTDERMEFLDKWAVLIEQYNITGVQQAAVDYYELIEGSAYYIESNIYKYLEGDEAYSERYMQLAEEYGEGTQKYYVNGMLKCLLLTELDPGWSGEFNCSDSFTSLLLDAMEG